MKAKENHIRQLEGILEDQDALKEKNVRLSRQIKACELLVFIFKNLIKINFFKKITLIQLILQYTKSILDTSVTG